MPTDADNPKKQAATDPLAPPLQDKHATTAPQGRAARAFYRHNNGLDNEDLSNIVMPSHWAVPWSDLMMVMMVMFAVMLAANLAERDVAEMFAQDAPANPSHYPPPESTQTNAPSQLPPRQDQTNTTQVPENTTPKDAANDPSAAPQTDELTQGDGATTTQDSGDAEPRAIPIEDILRLSKNLVTEANLEDIDVVLTANQSIKVSVRGNLLFDLGKADLKPEAISFLNKFAQIIAANNYQIEVAGHTDSFPVSNPAYPTNWELSSARAARVARYLIQQGRLEPGRFTILGYSYYRPLAPNTSLANKAKNRRVEILITRYEYTP